MRSKFAVKVGAASALTALIAAGTLAGSAAAAGPRVTVRVEGNSGTLLHARHVRLRRGWLVRHGHGRGVCSRASAQAALAAATRGHWSGIWYASYGEWEITRILGSRAGNSSHWWELYVNNRPAQVGACEAKLRAGDHVVFAAVSGNGEDLLGLRVARTVTSGHRFRARAVYYDARGHARPLGGATVSLNGHRTTTGRNGFAWLLANVAGVSRLRVSHRGYVRTERRLRVRA